MSLKKTCSVFPLDLDSLTFSQIQSNPYMKKRHHIICAVSPSFCSPQLPSSCDTFNSLYVSSGHQTCFFPSPFPCAFPCLGSLTLSPHQFLLADAFPTVAYGSGWCFQSFTAALVSSLSSNPWQHLLFPASVQHVSAWIAWCHQGQEPERW